MSAPRTAARTRAVTAGLLVPLLAALAACGGSSSGEEPGEEGEVNTGPCPSSISQTASTQPPSDVPTPEGADAAYDYFAQGATKVWYFALDGDAGELADLRDTYDSTLEAKGYEIEDTDQEEGHEAESEFKGPHEGTTNFRTLCEGKVVLRLKLAS